MISTHGRGKGKCFFPFGIVTTTSVVPSIVTTIESTRWELFVRCEIRRMIVGSTTTNTTRVE